MSPIPETEPIVNTSVSTTLFHPRQTGGSMLKIPDLSFKRIRMNSMRYLACLSFSIWRGGFLSSVGDPEGSPGVAGCCHPDLLLSLRGLRRSDRLLELQPFRVSHPTSSKTQPLWPFPLVVSERSQLYVLSRGQRLVGYSSGMAICLLVTCVYPHTIETFIM